MPNVEWSAAHDLVTPLGTVLLNQPDATSGYTFAIQKSGYKIVPALRVTQDNLSQDDGSFLHPRWKTGLVASITVKYLISTNLSDLIDYQPACDADVRIMHEQLTLVLDAIRSEIGTQRLIWTPSQVVGGPSISRRMLDFIQTLGWTEPAYDDADGAVEVTFQLETAFPYGIDFTQQSDAINATTATLTNPGTSKFKPVVQVAGPATTFNLTNNSVVDEDGNPLEINYDGGRTGASPIASGHYAEIDFFRGSIFLDGNGADLTAGIDPTTTDFFPLAPGANSITTDCDATFLWNPAWS